MRERHRGQRANWLRAAVLGADDGIVSVASVMIGVIASGASRSVVLTAAVAALVAGAGSMAAGEYVSVSSQRDTERADLALERSELSRDPSGEARELASIYRNRGLSPELADQVAQALMVHDALEAHARDELGLADSVLARPVQAALSSAASFTVGAVLPIAALLIAPAPARTIAVIVTALVALVALGIAGAIAGGAPVTRAALRVGIGGGGAMAVTAGVGRLVGSAGSDPRDRAPKLLRPAIPGPPANGPQTALERVPPGLARVDGPRYIGVVIVPAPQGQRIALGVLALLVPPWSRMTCRRASLSTTSGPTSRNGQEPWIDRVRRHRPVTRLVRPPLLWLWGHA
jgi:VIT1/CCC1 family predicted Fe2+/Mn2+ transporter